MGPDLCKDQRKHCRAQLGGIFRRTPASPRAEGFFGAPQLPPGEGRQALLWNAHAGSRTRVTSMGGLYDAATLRALTLAFTGRMVLMLQVVSAMSACSMSFCMAFHSSALCTFSFFPLFSNFILSINGACSVAASYKPPMLVTRVRLPACAFPLLPRMESHAEAHATSAHGTHDLQH